MISVLQKLQWLVRYWLTLIVGVAFAFMTMLSVEQGKVIASQGYLIQTLTHDSLAYIVLKGKYEHERHQR